MNSIMQAWAEMPPIFADRLMALLSAPGRIAHGLHRTNQLLLDADRFCEPHWLRPLRWAILYRHAVFDPLAAREDNAQASAELWAEHFSAIHDTVRNVSAAWEEDVASAILADPLDRPGDLLAWQQALLDLDLGWLGLAPDLYRAHRLLAAGELAACGGSDGPDRQNTFLARALATPRLYRKIHGDREDLARANLQRDVAACGPL